MINTSEVLEIEVGNGLASLVNAVQEGGLIDRIRTMKTKSLNTGFLIPPVKIHENLQLQDYEYNILIKGTKVGGGDLPGQLLAIDSGSRTGVINGVRTAEPIYKFPAVWIKPIDREQAERYGYTVVDNPTIIATHVIKVAEKHTRELLADENCRNFLTN